MPYFTRTDIESEIPPADLVALLDDEHDGAEDTGLYTALAARAEARVNAILQRRYSLPFATVPLAVAEAAILSLCAGLYRRRGTKDGDNPFAEREQSAMQFLKDAASGQTDLSTELDATGGANRIDGEDTLSADDLAFDLANQEGL